MLTRIPRHYRAKSGAFSLIELLIALLLGALLLAMVISLYVTGVSTGANSLQYSRLRTDLQSIMAMLETDIRRAGLIIVGRKIVILLVRIIIKPSILTITRIVLFITIIIIILKPLRVVIKWPLV